jgi:ArsR family transcriptional regulator
MDLRRAHRPGRVRDPIARAYDLPRSQVPALSIGARKVPGYPALLRTPLGREGAEELACAFKAIAEPGRLRLLSFIAVQPGAEACVCHLVGQLGLAQPTVSHHLRVLSDAGLLARERRGTLMFYRLVPECVTALRQALTLPDEKVAKPSP